MDKMLTINVKNATAAQLNWLVAKCEGYNITVFTVQEQRARHLEFTEPKRLEAEENYYDEFLAPDAKPKIAIFSDSGSGFKRSPTHEDVKMLVYGGSPEFQYATSWAQAGPIIEREKIRLDPRETEWKAQSWLDDYPKDFFGSTALIAAMRCYVASKLGIVVEIPEEFSEM